MPISGHHPGERTLRRGEHAAWGHRSTDEPRLMRLISFRPITKGSLRGFASIELPIGLIIDDVPVVVSSGKAWAGLPANPQIEDGRAKKDVNGRLAYTTILRWRDHDIGDRFSAAVVGLVRARHPEIFADGRSP